MVRENIRKAGKFDIKKYSGLIEEVESDISNNHKIGKLNNMTVREYLRLEGEKPIMDLNIVTYMQKCYNEEIKGLEPSHLYKIARRILSELSNYKKM